MKSSRRIARWGLRTQEKKLGKILFGDHYGFSIFLGSLLFLFAIWRTDFFITDNYAIANTLVSVSRGHLWVDPIVFGPSSGIQPGMHVVDGRLYGRNYGLVFLSLPWLWTLEFLSLLFDIRVLIAAVWSILLILLSMEIGHLLDREATMTVIGCTVGLLAFAGNVWLATPLLSQHFPIMALQLTTMTAVGFTGVLGYRITTRSYSTRYATLVGFALVFATPLTFWGVVPKRHAVTTVVILVILFGFVNSRDVGESGRTLRYRSLVYIAIGLLAWIHAAEALALFVVVAPIDYFTAPSNRPRDLFYLGLAFIVSLVPFFLTNTLISGNPFQPPRMLPSVRGQELIAGGQTAETVSGVTDPAATSDGTQPGWALFSPAVILIISGLERFVGFLLGGFMVVFRNPDRLVGTFIRSGWLESAQAHNEPAINLALLESTPLLGLLAAAAAGITDNFKRKMHSIPRFNDWTKHRKTEFLLFSIAGIFILLYLPRLPLHAQVTVRYLAPIIPLLVIAASRFLVVSKTIERNYRVVVWSYASASLVGGQLLAVTVLSLDPTLGESVQLHGLLGIGVATILAIWAVSSNFIHKNHEIAGSILIGIAGALATVFVLMASWVYFDYGQLALGLTRVISEALIAAL